MSNNVRRGRGYCPLCKDMRPLVWKMRTVTVREENAHRPRTSVRYVKKSYCSSCGIPVKEGR